MITRLWLTPLLSLAVLGVSVASKAASFGVTHTSGSGQGSLRQAILDANTHGEADALIFNIPMDELGGLLNDHCRRAA